MIALLGSSGYLGRYFAQYFEQNNIQFVPVTARHIFNSDQLSKIFDHIEADFVINCAGYTGKPNVDACELNKGQCLWANAVLPSIINEACFKTKIPWGHISSGCIYTGCRVDGLGFTERDIPNFSFRSNNCSFYSGTKALGEEIIKGYDCYIWRLRIPFDHIPGPRNYISKILSYKQLLEAENSFSYIPEFIDCCYKSYINKLDFGIYNLTNPGSLKTSDVIELIKKHNISHKPFDLIGIQEFSRLVNTPRSNCVLDCTKAIDSGLQLSPIITAFEEALSRWPK